MAKLLLNGEGLTIAQITRFLAERPAAGIAAAAAKKVRAARRLVDEWIAKDDTVYGVTTGFGEFANVRISRGDIRKLQENLIVSHAAGCGDPLPDVIVRLMMLLRANALVKGYSGIRLQTLQTLLAMLNKDLLPVIPSQGSVGSSGDLVQLSHLALALIGKGSISVPNGAKGRKVVPAAAALRKAGITPVVLDAKEGLALINGTQMMTAFGAYICARAAVLKKTADIAAALSHEALRATDRAFDIRIHLLRPHPGQQETAMNILNLIEGSTIRDSHRHNDPRVQDAYSLRCVPQVHGASRDAIAYVQTVIETEMNSATDNPLLIPGTGEHLEGGNFHGQPVALAMDFMGIALAELANISERRTERMVNGALSYGLPRFLTRNGGLNSGLMIAQYTAASLVSENKVLAHPASVDSIPTSANQEDHNSMGSIAAQKCYRILQNVEQVLAIELLTAAQAIDFLKPLTCGKGTGIAHKQVRAVIPHLNHDRLLHTDIARAITLVRSGELTRAVEKKIKLV